MPDHRVTMHPPDEHRCRHRRNLRWVRKFRALRRERAELTDTDFARDQRGFLESLVDRPNIYFTSHFQHLFEHVARDNIHRLFGCLDSGVSWQ